MIRKYFPTITFLVLLICMVWSIWLLPSLTFVFVTGMFLLFLAMSTFFIFEKHKDVDGKRRKITRDILILIITLGLIVLLSRLVGTWVGRQAQAQWGAQVGLLCALIVSFIIGYGVKKASSKLLESRA